MVSIRGWLDFERTITTRHRRLQSTQVIRDDLLVGTGPKDQAEFLEMLIAYLGNNIGVVIESLDESIDQFEVATGGSASSASHGELGGLRRKTAYMRRFLAPQEEMLSNLAQDQNSKMFLLSLVAWRFGVFCENQYMIKPNRRHHGKPLVSIP